jgi:hypothetical protein
MGNFSFQLLETFAYWLIHKKEGKVKGDFRADERPYERELR